MKYVVFSNHVNAWTIKKGLKKLGKELEVYTPNLKNNIIKHTVSHIPKNSTLFFTEENNLKNYINSFEYKFYPRSFPSVILDDKFEFANFLYSINEIAIPYTDINSALQYPFFLKAKHSWKNDEKLPRGYICENEDDLNENIVKLKEQNFSCEWFFKQKLLTSPLENNISVSGFFDHRNSKRNVMLVTKKVFGSEKKITTGVAVETIVDPNNLIDRTKNILINLNYTGPFEMEFFYERSDNKYYVLELNPRFWMQHGIFIEHYQNAIIKRYLNIDQTNDWFENGVAPFKKIIWIDNLFYLNSILRGNKEYVNFIRRLEGSKVFYPSNSAVISLFMKKFKRKVLVNK